MRPLRSLLVATVACSLLALPIVAAAQSSGPAAEVAPPLARQPDGHLPLEGTPWRLQAYRDGQRAAVPGPEVAAVLSFTSGLFEGSGGCAGVRGRYGVNGAALRIEPRSSPERACPENLALVQRAVENGLSQAGSYGIERGATYAEDQLVIRSVAGVELLRYGLDDLAQLDAAEWRLELYTVEGVEVPASRETPALLSFRPDADAVSRRRQSGPLVGSSGCNGIVAEFYRQADVLSLGALGVTDAPCTPEIAAQQTALIAVLDATAIELDLPYERLILTSVDSGERLEFLSQVPLEGSTWWLEGPADAGSDASLDQRVTLRLLDGDASGEGPCGPYHASYVTDGAFISFTDVRGARLEDCPAARAERAFLGGLRRTVVVARSSEGLAFEDAQGRRTLGFSRPFAP